MFPIHDDNPTERTPVVTVALIAACILVYFWQASLDAREANLAIYSFGFIPAVFFDQAQLSPELAVIPSGATVVSSMFLHGGLMHLVGNMLYLWVFGNNVEDAMGHGRFVVFYLLCGTAAALAQALPDPASEIPMVGASGAISGVLGAYLILFPHARVFVLIPLGFVFLQTIPARWLLIFWFGFQLLSGLLADAAQGGVAFWAHVGGFVAGMALIPFMKDRAFRTRRAVRGSRLPRIQRRSGPWG
jgi:membrane associated rhomboid family serine protease